MARTLGSLNIGDKVKFGSIYGNPIVWVISDKDHPGYPANSVSLITEKIIKLMAFDAIEASNSNLTGNHNGFINGNSRYGYSNILQWLNKDTSPWYVAQHDADAPPTQGNCLYNNHYDDIPGFLNSWSADEKAALLDTTVDSGYMWGQNGYSYSTNEKVTSKIFLLSWEEVGGSAIPTSTHPLFSDNASRVAYPTADAIANSDYKDQNKLGTEMGWDYWLRSILFSYPDKVFYILGVAGQRNDMYAYIGNVGLRPACNLLSSNLVSGMPDGDGCYTMIYSQLPTDPGAINVPEHVIFNSKITISWSASTDPKGKAVSYILEKSSNDKTWQEVYSGENLMYEEGAVTVGTWKYRVKAINADGAESAYLTSTFITVEKLPPTAPEPIIVTVSPPVQAGSSVEVSCGKSTDPCNRGGIEYNFMRKVNDSNWKLLYYGIMRFFSDTIPSDAHTLQYGVQATVQYPYDCSDMATSSIITISKPAPTTISGNDADLGTFVNSFSGYTYTVSGADGNAVTVQEIIDDVIFRTYTPALDDPQNFELTGNDWFKIPNGTHTVKIVVTDTSGETETRTLTFFKDVDTIEFYTSKLAADAMPTAVLVNVQGSFPTGSILTVMACNNADDSSPAWQDISSSVGKKAFFTNTVKTAAGWAVKLHITLRRGTATLPCYISSAEGGFASL